MSLSSSNLSFSKQTIISHDIDHLGELVKPWDLQLEKLNKGTEFIGRVDHIISDDFLIYKTDFSGILQQKGEPPKGMRTFWLPVDDDQHFYLRNQNLNGSQIGFFPMGAELDAVTQPGFKVYVISVPENILVRLAANMQIDWIGICQYGYPDNLIINVEKSRYLRNIINQLFKLDTLFLLPGIINKTFEALRGNLLEQLIIISRQVLNSKIVNPSNRLRVFQKAKEYIHSNPTEDLNSSDLCQYTASSERTLQYSMKEHTGLSPSQYVKAIKLNFIRKKLIIGDPKYTIIKELANSYGFWHSSQFSVDYKNLFGELPSDTLRK